MRNYWWVAVLWIVGAVLSVMMSYGPSSHLYSDGAGECGAGAWKYDC